MTVDADSLKPTLVRIADALERLAPAPAPVPDFDAADAFVWQLAPDRLSPVAKVNHVDLALLKGIDHVRDILWDNTKRFAAGLPANNTLLWGARGMGKSSLVKAVHAAVNAERPQTGRLLLVEVHREDIHSLPRLLKTIAGGRRALIFCDDLSFDGDDTTYKSLKAVLDGGIEGRPDNILFYATSNRRHLMPRQMIENERSSAINPAETVDEKVSLSDRFGLWLGFHGCSQDQYLAMVDAYCEHFGLKSDRSAVHRQALEWATTRGARSGRVAWQFILDLAGRQGVILP